MIESERYNLLHITLYAIMIAFSSLYCGYIYLVTRDVGSVLSIMTFCNHKGDNSLGSTCSLIMIALINTIGWVTALVCSFLLVFHFSYHFSAPIRKEENVNVCRSFWYDCFWNCKYYYKHKIIVQ